MIEWHITQHQVALAGIVTDVGTGKALAGADVTLVEMPAEFRRKVEGNLLKYGRGAGDAKDRLDRTQTRPDGLFYFVDLPSGNYTIVASVPKSAGRYASSKQSATVSRDANGSLQKVFVNFALQSTGFKGKITATDGESGIAMADVRVKGGAERTFTDAQGEYVLPYLQPGRYTLSVRAQGYQPVEKSAALASAGDVEDVDFLLEKESAASSFGQRAASKRTKGK